MVKGFEVIFDQREPNDGVKKKGISVASVSGNRHWGLPFRLLSKGHGFPS